MVAAPGRAAPSWRALLALVPVAWTAIGCRPSGDVTVAVDTTERYQTLAAWEAHAYVGYLLPGFPRWVDSLVARAVVDLGITRLRLEVRSGAEADSAHYVLMRQRGGFDPIWRCRRYPTVNDDDDPHHLNRAGFHFEEMDTVVTHTILPARRLLAERGDTLRVTLTYVAFTRIMCPGLSYGHADPEEYAEFMLAAVQHLRERWGFVPDAIEPILEPDNGTAFADGEHLGAAIAATDRRLRAAGFAIPFIAPSTMRAGTALDYLDGMARVPGALDAVAEIAYHRYHGVDPRTLAAIAARAAALGKRTAMLEHIGADHHELWQDLTVANVSAWQQYTLGGPGEDGGGAYFGVDSAMRPVMLPRTRYLWPYMRWVRPGAVRVAARLQGIGEATAFHDGRGAMTVLMNLPAAGMARVTGLPPGTARWMTVNAAAIDSGRVASDSPGTYAIPVRGAGVAALRTEP